jgi:hypothetical protein
MTFRQTELMMRRTDAMEKWHVKTCICPTMDTATEAAESFFKRTHHVMMWPLKQGRWLVTARLPMLAS